MKVLKTPREVWEFCDSLTSREAEQLVRLMDSTPEIVEALHTKGLVIKLVRRRKSRKSLSASVNEAGKMEVCCPRL